jgi:hypothetical protein
MGDRTRHGRWLLLAVTILGIDSAASSALAGDDDDLVEPRLTAPGNEPLGFLVDGAGGNLDNLIFGNNGDGSTPEQRLVLQLHARVREVARMTAVSKAQEEKLLLAGEGDIRRFIDRIEEVKGRFPDGPRDQNAWNQISQEIRPLQAEVRAGLFGRRSLFGKTIAKMLSPEQALSFTRIERERRRFQHRAGVNMTVLRLSTALGLSDEQQTRLKALLLKETRPARLRSPTYPAGFFNVVYAQMGRIPEAKLKPLFEPWQWQALRVKIASAGNFGGGALEPADDPEDVREPPQRPAAPMKQQVQRRGP